VPDEGELTADETIAEGDFDSMGDEFAASLGGDEVLEEDAELAGVGATTLPPDSEGPIDSGMPAEPLKPAVHWLTYVLIGLNFIAAPVFGYFLLQDNQKRQEHQYAILQLDLAMMGLPTKDEEENAVAARLVLPNSIIPQKHLEAILQARGVKFASEVAPMNEQIVRRFRPSELTDEILREHFGKEQPVKTVEDEMNRLAGTTVDAIKEAAKSPAPKDDADARAQVRKLLLSLASNNVQTDKLNKKIDEAKDAELTALLVEAAERRMAFDFLMPLEMFRPGDLKDFSIEMIADLEALPTAAVLKRVEDRIKSTLLEKFDPKMQLGWVSDSVNDPQDFRLKRETAEKRLMASFTMLSLAYVKRPNGAKLEPELLDRIPLIVGQYDAALAATLFPALINDFNQRVVTQIQQDLVGYAVKKDDKETRVQGFPDRYEDLLQQIRFVQQDSLKAKRRLADLEAEKVKLGKLLDERNETVKTILDSIEVERAKTQKLNGELLVLQRELFEFERQLSTSEEELAGVNSAIQKRYSPPPPQKLSSPKGGK
jgi:hypothetical protein